MTMLQAVRHLLYGVLLLGAAMTLLAPAAALPSLLLIVAWSYVFHSSDRPRALFMVFGIPTLACCLPAMLFWPMLAGAPEAASRTQYKSNVRQIELALQNYHDTFEAFPPAYTVDASGRRLLSWRVLILPYIDESTLHAQFDLNQPWDSPQNLVLLDEMPDLFACPSSTERQVAHETSTHYVAVVGEGTAWPGVDSSHIADFKDGTANTVLIVECDADIPWTSPRDLELEEGLATLSSLNAQAAMGHSHVYAFTECFDGRYVLFADGSIHWIGHGIDADGWRGLLTLNDGTGGDWEVNLQQRRVTGVGNLRVDSCIKFAVFVVIALFPLPWVWWNPRSEYGRGGTMTDDISAG